VNTVFAAFLWDCARRNPANHDEQVQVIKGLTVKSLKLNDMVDAVGCGS
jgi:hypothetical protein